MLAVLAMAPISIGEGLMLCICQDGHVAIETACDPPLCCPEEGTILNSDAASSFEFVLSAAQDAQCCIDIPLFANGDASEQALSPNRGTSYKAPVPCGVAVRCADPPRGLPALTDKPATAVPTVDSAVGTTVLRI